MVHYRADVGSLPVDASVNPSTEYWKLKNPAQIDKFPRYSRKLYSSYLTTSLRDPEHVYTKHAPLRLRFLAARAERGLPIYDSCSKEELRNFATSRSLIPAVSTTYPSEGRADLIALLEKTDDQAEFPFEKLPAELRVAVYGFYLQDLPNGKASPAQPPITRVSKLIRQEALPLFYDTAAWHLHLEFKKDTYKLYDCDFDFPILKSLKRASRLLSGNSPALAHQIRKLQVHVKVEHDGRYYPGVGALLPYDIDFELSVSLKGTLDTMPILECTHGEPGRWRTLQWSLLTLADQLQQSTPKKVDKALSAWFDNLTRRHDDAAAERVPSGVSASEEENGEGGGPSGLRLEEEDLETLRALHMATD